MPIRSATDSSSLLLWGRPIAEGSWNVRLAKYDSESGADEIGMYVDEDTRKVKGAAGSPMVPMLRL